MKLFAIRARSIHRTSRKDPGREGIWLVQATTPEQAMQRWRAEPRTAEWVHESTAIHAPTVTRML